MTFPVGAHPDNVAQARLVAEAWAESQGMEIGAGSFSVIASQAQGGWLGVSFDVIVGKGDIDAQGESWTWSARIEHWRARLAPARRMIAAATDGKASVTRIHARDGGSGRAGIASGDPLLLRDGCSCHIGGPFVDICPVHYQADR